MVLTLRSRCPAARALPGGPAGASSSSNGTTTSSSSGGGSSSFEQHDGALTEHLRKKGDVLVSNSPDGIYRGFVPEDVLAHKLDNGLQALYRTRKHRQRRHHMARARRRLMRGLFAWPACGVCVCVAAADLLSTIATRPGIGEEAGRQAQH